MAVGQVIYLFESSLRNKEFHSLGFTPKNQNVNGQEILRRADESALAFDVQKITSDCLPRKV